MNPDRRDMLRARAAATVHAAAADQRDWLATEALLARDIFNDTLRDPAHRDRVLSVLAGLAPSFTTQLARILHATTPQLLAQEPAA